MASILLKVNGKARTVNVDPGTPLLYVLRNDVGVHGPKFGCGLAQCGACTVIVSGETMRSCVAPVSPVQGKEITTLEGLGTLPSIPARCKKRLSKSRPRSAATA